MAPLNAQIAVGPSGSSTLTFEILPPASQWATRTTPGTAGEVTAQAALDAQVQTNFAGLIASQLTSAAGVPPPGNAVGMFATDGQYISTRPAGNRFNLLRATLRNDSGFVVTELSLAYDLGVVAPTTEQVPGHSVYFSLTGATGTWQYVPGLSGAAAPLRKIARLPLGVWPTNALLYVLWADDNGSGSPDTSLSIDNFLVTPVPAAPTITNQPQSQSVAPGGDVFFTVGASGVSPFFYQWLTNGIVIPGATNEALFVTNAQVQDEANYSVIITNAYGVALSSNATLTVACVTPANISSPPQGQLLFSGDTLSLSVAAAGTQPIQYQWLRNGAALPEATNAIFLKLDAQTADSGLYSVIVSNCAGSVTSPAALVSVPQRTYPLIGLTNNFWRYDQSGADLGTDWRTADYDDSGWPSGRGLFAREDFAGIAPLTNTVLSLTSSGPAQTITYYFRTRFTLTNALADAQLVASNYFDDGAVVYLNGAEAFRFNMPAGPIYASTLASAANPLGEGTFVVSNLPMALLQPGDNVLAVEVHQNNFTSSDVAFGMNLNVTFFPPTPLLITNQPADVIASENESLTLSVGVDGVPVNYQWFKGGVAIPGATAAMLTVNNLTTADAGSYVVVASNVVGVVVSHAAMIGVLTDQAAPVVVGAQALDPIHVLVAFSEPMLAGGATNVAHYSVTNTFGAAAAVSRAVLTNGTNVLLTTSPLSDNANYILSVAGLVDASPQQNALPLSAVPIARLFTLVSFGNYWEYLDPFPPFGEPDPGPGWNNFAFNTSTWGYEPGSFAFSQDDNFVPPVPVGTALAQTPVHTAYFRATLTSGFSPGGLALYLRHAVDDGAVFYLNGAEAHRFNLPAGVVTASTPAAVALFEPTLRGPVELPDNLLRAGENLLAAELHQFAPNDPLKFFAAELVARAESLLVGPLVLLSGPRDTVVIENQPVSFRVSQVAAATFQWQMNGTNLPATNATLTFTAPLSLNGAKVRCICANGVSSVTSSEATLYILRDVVRPTLLGAIANNDGTITLSFSEPLESATAETILNYSVTNADGFSAPIAGAVLTNGTNVILSFAGTLSGNQTVVVNGVTDTASQPNAVPPASAARVAANYFVPMVSAWKYLLINTNPTVQATFMQTNYDDSAWLGPSNALLHVESATLPAPKNTLLSMVDETGNNRINTHYFRQNFVAPIIASSVTVRLRHIIDDGMVLHLNGKELYRFNIPAGPVTAGTQAAANVGDALLVGPIELPNVTNLVAGTNLLAVEVHQQGNVSADMAMGVELSISIPGGPLPVPADLPALAVTRIGEQLALHWGESGFVLERADDVNGPWTVVSASAPYFVAPVQSAAFYRLRR